jgi:subtilisin family serine protease
MRRVKGVVSRMETPKKLTLVAATILVATIVAAVVVAPSLTQNATPAASTYNFNLVPIGGPVAPPTPELQKNTPVPSGDVIVQYKSGVISSPAASDVVSAANKQVGAMLVQTSTVMPGLTLVKLPVGASADAAIALYKSNPAVEGAWPNDERTLTATPDDPGFPAEWGLDNVGQTFLNHTGSPGVDINASGAWETTTGSSSVIVAVADTGVDINHPDLKGNVGPGYDFVYYTSDPMPAPWPGSWHGTHVAGTIGAVTNNEVGIAGVSQKVTIMPLQIFGMNGKTTVWPEVQAIMYAERHGASIINLSLGGGSYNALEYQVIRQSPLLFVCAAGNDAKDNDQRPYYPASYNSPNIIRVAASDSNGNVASFSDYGAKSVDLAAPGVRIESLYYQYNYGPGYYSADGTSMAAPHVSGVAALVKAAHPDYGYAELKRAILSTTDPLPAFAGKTVTGGMLDAGKAVLYNAL